MLKKWGKATTLFLGTIILSLLTGCGGGLNTNTSTSTQTQISINEKNANQVISDLFNATTNITPQLPELLTTKTTSLTLKQLIVKPEHKVSVLRSRVATPGNCADGGSAIFNALTVTYSNCNDGNTTLDGKITVGYNGNTKQSKYTLTNFSINRTDTQYFTSLTTYLISSNTISFQATGQVIKGGQKVAFEKFKYTLTSSNNQNLITMKGALKTDCLSNWTYIETIHPITISGKACPTSGEIISKGGNSELKVLFNQNNSVETYLNGKVYAKYTNCNELPNALSGCKL